MKRGIDSDISSRMSANGSCFAPERHISQTLELVPPHRFHPRVKSCLRLCLYIRFRISNFIIPEREDSSDFGL